MAIVGKNFSWDFEVCFLGGGCLQAAQTLASAGRFGQLIHSESPSSPTQADAYYDFHANPGRASCCTQMGNK